MKKFFLLFSAVLFLGSCTDLSVSEEDAVKDALPKDFNWEVYAEINSDVKMSQVIFKIREEKGESDTTKSVRENCVNLLGNLEFAKKIYVDYAGCPDIGWDRNELCTGKYAYNSSYSIAKIDTIVKIETIVEPDTTYTDTSRIVKIDNSCNIGACWHGGWDDIGAADFEDSDKCDDIEYLQENPDILAKCEELPKPFYSFLPDSLAIYKSNGRRGGNQISLMCKFVPLAGTVEEAEDHLESLALNIDSKLVELHYIEFGRHDGRPYKYCKSGNRGVLRDIELASKKQSGSTVYYDYGAHIFCLDEKDEIYTTVEE
jgi:hypothetical protein